MSVQTTDRYLGCTQRIACAVNDKIGIEPVLTAASWKIAGRPALSHAKLPRTPVNFFCDLRLTSEARLSKTARTRFMQPSGGCAASNAHGEWKCHGPYPMGVKARNCAPSKNSRDRRGDMFHSSTLWPGRPAARGGLFQRGPGIL